MAIDMILILWVQWYPISASKAEVWVMPPRLRISARFAPWILGPALQFFFSNLSQKKMGKKLLKKILFGQKKWNQSLFLLFFLEVGLMCFFGQPWKMMCQWRSACRSRQNSMFNNTYQCSFATLVALLLISCNSPFLIWRQDIRWLTGYCNIFGIGLKLPAMHNFDNLSSRSGKIQLNTLSFVMLGEPHWTIHCKKCIHFRPISFPLTALVILVGNGWDVFETTNHCLFAR